MRPLKQSEIAGYAVGDLGINLNFQMIGFYLAYFYTDVFGLTPGHVTGLFLAARVWDAVNDPLMGFIADSTRSRWGRFRPYVFFGAIPLNLALLACFATPDLGETGKIVYAYVTYILHGMVFTAVGLPYSSLTAALTQDQQERAVISSYRMFFAVVVAMSIVSVGVRPMVGAFENEEVGFKAIAAGFAVVSTILLLIAARFSKERVPVPMERYGLKDLPAIVLKNRALLVLSLSMFLNTCVWVIPNAVALYYFKYYVDDVALFEIFFMFMLPANVLGALAAPRLSRRIGKRATFLTGSALVALFYTARFFVPPATVWLLIGVSMAGTFSQMLNSVMQWGMVPDTVEYGEYKTGRRSEGIPFAFFSFTQKLGMAIGGALATFALSQSGYVANQAQEASTMFTIRSLFTLAPAAASLLCLGALLLYELDGSTFERIKIELAQRRSAAAKSTPREATEPAWPALAQEPPPGSSPT